MLGSLAEWAAGGWSYHSAVPCRIITGLVRSGRGLVGQKISKADISVNHSEKGFVIAAVPHGLKDKHSSGLQQECTTRSEGGKILNQMRGRRNVSLLVKRTGDVRTPGKGMVDEKELGPILSVL